MRIFLVNVFIEGKKVVSKEKGFPKKRKTRKKKALRKNLGDEKNKK